MGVNSLPATVTRQRHGYDLNPGPSAPESRTLTTRLLSHPWYVKCVDENNVKNPCVKSFEMVKSACEIICFGVANYCVFRY